MTNNEYLEKVLASQTLKDDSDELKALREHRTDVEKLLRNKFSESSPTIRYGGSVAKGTLVRVSYDLDIICYFKRDDTGPGATLEDIYKNVRDALGEKYYVQERSSALRLKSKDMNNFGVDFHIDVVPGRFVDDTKTDTYLYQSSGDKCRLKTNLDVHLEHVKSSGLVDVIRLVKVWKKRNGLSIRNFPLELMTIEVLKDVKKKDDLESCLTKFWQQLNDSVNDIKIEDPANPTGNDLSEILNDGVKATLSYAAAQTLQSIESSGWESVFGKLESISNEEKTVAINHIAATISKPAKPWCDQ